MSLLSEEELKQLEEEEEQEKYESMKDENEPPNKKLKKNSFIPYLNNDFVKKIHEYIYVDSIVNIKEYLLYQCNIPLLANPSKFDDIIFNFDVHEVEDIKEVI